MEVPTVVSHCLLQRIMEQNVDIPVLGGGGRFAVLKVSHLNRAQFSTERNSERIVEQIVDDPVPSGGGRRGRKRCIRTWPKLVRTDHEILAVSRPGQSSTAFSCAEHETLAGSRPGESSTEHETLAGSRPGQSSIAFGAAEHETPAGFPPGQGSPAFDGAQYGFLQGSSSTASHEAEHLGFLRGSSSAALSSWSWCRCG